jgi:hypothetical protein
LILIITEKIEFYRVKNNSHKLYFLLDNLNSFSNKICNYIKRCLLKHGSEIKNSLIIYLKTTNNKQTAFNLISVLCQLKSPPIANLIQIVAKNPDYSQKFKDELLKQKQTDSVIITLINMLENTNLKQKRIITNIITELPANKVIPLLQNKMNKKMIDIEIFLEIIASFGAISETKDLISKIKNIIIFKKNMWIRYQALKTLKAIHPEPEQILPFLKKLFNDNQELVRIEAQGIWQEINDSIKIN